ncbi:aminotransferase class III-fold pyridoxal phosphate-dependent enzyme [Pontibacterium sp. N1Y112]|uniref:Aminotransferase class III-fold pyridoxal phosphate-dependent enzyme n=1 Tax=Pontibacterium sinense TaxID=2781979 RepID=A0A8J7FQ17_9GAMM|nr:aminotransferase class III-fold pyridoxal phosphate-dependent enzyme [Pontibacterium sinense]MBE9398067.1 aminotransferase class III-fold pyridoxal phosphate-dependent enzyme [Pontibacterium sinense]
MNKDALMTFDRQHLFHPVLPPHVHEEHGALILESAKGAYVKDIDGHELLDGFSGLWCVNAGYGHESIINAAHEQLKTLPYATGYFHFASEPTIQLAKRLADLAPGNLNKVYFTLGGSDAVDSAIRLIRFYFNSLGKLNKKNIIALEKGYHGSSSTGAGLTALPVFHQKFDLPLAWQHHIPSHYPYRNGEGLSDQEIINKSVSDLKAKVEQLGGPDHVAAFFCEPVQGSGGVIVPPTGYLKAMRDTCRELDILFLADEVITGFGRTGPMFACETEGVVPDMMTVAKGLTSGYAPMGALLMGDHIYDVIADGAGNTPVGHGFTYSGHPVSAAIGLAVLDLYESGGLLDNGQKVGNYFEQKLRGLSDHPLIGEVRTAGMLAGIELVVDKTNKTKPSAALQVSPKMYKEGYKNGLIFRAFADDVIGFAPPLCCTVSDIDILIARFEKTLNNVLNIEEIRNEVV